MPAPALLLIASIGWAQSLELSRDFQIAGSERLAMGGAGLALAQGVGGSMLVPGAQARRSAGRYRPVQPGLGLRVTGLGWTGSDLADVGASMRGLSGALGAGLLVERYGLCANGMLTLTSTDAEHRLWEGEAQAALSASTPAGHLQGGLGLTVFEGEIQRPDAHAGWLMAAPTAGLLLDFPASGLSSALSLRGPARDGNVRNTPGVEGAVMPPQGAVGLAWASVAGPTPLRRHPTRVAGDLVVTGATSDGLSPEAWMLGLTRARGRAVSLVPHLGAEIELIPDRLRLRGGSYVEPPRTDGAPRRAHGTGGLEVHAFDVKLAGHRWPVALRDAVDLAEDYTQIQLLGVDVWRSSGRGRASPRR